MGEWGIPLLLVLTAILAYIGGFVTGIVLIGRAVDRERGL